MSRDWARFDRTRRYRYELGRTWDTGSGRVCWVMLNPSTADARRDDPTIRRCASFSRAWGYGAMVVVNIFALRSTDPRRLRTDDDPVGPRNDRAIARAAAGSDAVVAAWGRHGTLDGRGRRVLELLEGLDVRALGVNADGTPRHPLYVPASTRARRLRVAS